MANLSIKTGTISRSMLVGNPAFIPSDYESIATGTGTGSNSTITFSSIPSTYKHLQLRILSKSTTTSVQTTQMRITFNSDTGSNYSYHRIVSDGTTLGATGAASITAVVIDALSITSISPINASTFSVGIIDIQDYSSTTRNKTVRSFAGADNNRVASGFTIMALNSSVWLNTSAISTIDVNVNSGNFAVGSVVSLYGIKG